LWKTSVFVNFYKYYSFHHLKIAAIPGRNLL